MDMGMDKVTVMDMVTCVPCPDSQAFFVGFFPLYVLLSGVEWEHYASKSVSSIWRCLISSLMWPTFGVQIFSVLDYAWGYTCLPNLSIDPNNHGDARTCPVLGMPQQTSRAALAPGYGSRLTVRACAHARGRRGLRLIRQHGYHHLDPPEVLQTFRGGRRAARGTPVGSRDPHPRFLHAAVDAPPASHQRLARL